MSNQPVSDVDVTPARRADGLGPDSPTDPLLEHPLVRLVTFAGCGVVGAVLILTLGVAWRTPWFLPLMILAAIALAFGYVGLVRFVERRRAFELAPSRAAGALWGLAFGVVAVAVSVGILTATGLLQVVGSRPEGQSLWPYFLVTSGLVAAVSEELFFRGIIYRLLEEWAGTWAALAASAIIFGAAHAMNPSATLVSAVYIAVEAGLLLGAIYLVTRSLWVVIGVHFAWNSTLWLLGLPVSGLPVGGFLRWSDRGPAWLTGGAFGPEASPVTCAVLLLVTVALVVVARRRGLIVPPSWVRRRRAAAAVEA